MPATHELAFARNPGVRTDGTGVLQGTKVPERTNPPSLTLLPRSLIPQFLLFPPTQKSAARFHWL